ncbi:MULTISPECIES: N-acetyltransferase [Vibrio]|uniref:GNAT family N-acetyltransferase n=1 Tax=Vibrio TaxID=662 RepID=UPI0012AD782F|nr:MULTISPECIES: GNAT family N-acetyltransferase [unclassified Vibrio]EKO3584035.1 GNAT family N-acetyltransferase [Vibrio metschnikovii]NAW80152.1 GNAT family N-acetyltransferase [Vibrio sp. V33_P6A3T137]EKO3608537.1 GNAT family N-acetyltransferase [Vibrio metschnikovii]EKO3695149.1 GNAT family N-acetyltransferase [Vibrio metschnikovii]EKO3764273.1 GNAT family N-acetyltransferase [Vibrio metschnikovii]
MEIEFYEATEIELASELTRLNMHTYYLARNLSWNHEEYEENWYRFANFSVTYDGKWVGIIRFSCDEIALYIRDLQIDTQYQNLGIGFSCLEYALEKLKYKKLNRLRLNVFSENPAISLYSKFGFERVAEMDGLVRMELIV